MSKLAIFLCLLVAAACATSAQAGIMDPISKKVDQAGDKVTDMIQSAVKSFREQFLEIRNSIMNDLEALDDKGSEIMSEVYKSVNEAQNKVRDRVAELTKEADGVDVSECTKKAEDFQLLANTVVRKSVECITNPIEDSLEHVENIDKVKNDLIWKLKNVRKEAEECSKGTNSIMDTGKVLSCYAKAEKDALVITTEKMPSVISNLSELASRAKTSASSVTACAESSTAKSYLEQASDVIAKIESCVQQKINENH